MSKTIAEIAKDLRSYANLIETGDGNVPGGFVSTGPALVTGNTDADIAVTGGYIDAQTGKFAKDMWVEGTVGAMKGASVTEWTQANQNLHMMGDPHPEQSVTVVGPPASWNYNLKTAWDVGWMAPRPDVPTDPGWAKQYGGGR